MLFSCVHLQLHFLLSISGKEFSFLWRLVFACKHQPHYLIKNLMLSFTSFLSQNFSMWNPKSCVSFQIHTSPYLVITHGGDSQRASKNSVYAFVLGRRLWKVNVFYSQNNGPGKDCGRPSIPAVFQKKALGDWVVWGPDTARLQQCTFLQLFLSTVFLYLYFEHGENNLGKEERNCGVIK